MAASLAASKTSSYEPPCLSFPTEFPYDIDSLGSNSGLDSPVDSVVSSTDGSSDDDDFFVGLAQQLSWTSLFESEKSLSPCFNLNEIENKCIRTGSPQSTLRGFDSWFRTECPSSQLKSPPMSVLRAENDARAILHAAARETTRLKMSGETIPCHNKDHFIKGPSIPVKSINNLDYGLFSNQNYAKNLAFDAQQVREDLVLQALRASSWRRQAKVGWSPPPYRKPEIHNREINIVHVSARIGGGSGGLSSPWLPPPQNHQPPPNTSAVRCIHPGGSGVKRASSGTGVFLPRRHVNHSDCRRHKREIPGIRFPEEIMNPILAPLNYCQSTGLDSILSRRNNPLLPMPRSFRAEEALNQELHLPQEWTY